MSGHLHLHIALLLLPLLNKTSQSASCEPFLCQVGPNSQQVMSLKSAMVASAVDDDVVVHAASGPLKNIKPLRTADQYDLWQARITDACYGICGKDIFEVTSQEAKDALSEPTKTKNEWCFKSWTLLRNSLHDELFVKVKHVERGHIPALLSEIRTALLVDSADEIQPIKVELYSASMRNCSNDLQTYVAYFKQRLNKLSFHGASLPDEESAPLFLKGLNDVFCPIVNAYSMPGAAPKDLNKLIEHIRKYASMPNIAEQLLKARSSTASAKVFIASSSNSRVAHSSQEKVACKSYSRYGKCKYGDRCKFSHPLVPNGEKQEKKITNNSTAQKNFPEKKCSYCVILLAILLRNVAEKQEKQSLLKV